MSCSRSLYRGMFVMISNITLVETELGFRFISRPPTRGRVASSSWQPKPLSPCLVHRTPPGVTRPSPFRRSSLPICDKNKGKNDGALTVPLRACCAKCEVITDECLKEGESWKEKFTRGARRRRSASLDDGRNVPDDHIGSSLSRQPISGFTPLLPDPELTRFRPPTFALTVDEVDKRRKSLEPCRDDPHRPQDRLSLDPYAFSTVLQPEKDSVTSLVSSPETSPSDSSSRRVRSSPIQEEDEDQLFPLPSPRRSPSGSPPASPSTSIGPSPTPSPNTSASCLAPQANPVASSEREVPEASPGLDDGILGHPACLRSGSSPASQVDFHVRPVSKSPSVGLFPTVADGQRSTSSGLRRHASNEALSRSSRWGLTVNLPTTRSLSRATASPPSSPNRSPRIPSFSIPFLKDALKGAGTDVLKGVSAMAGGNAIA